MSLQQLKFKSKNVKPKKKAHSKKFIKKQILNNKINQLNRVNHNILTLEEILNLVKKQSDNQFYGGIYFGNSYNAKYRLAPIGTDAGKEFWQLNEITSEMLKLKFNKNQWYLESGDLMLDQL